MNSFSRRAYVDYCRRARSIHGEVVDRIAQKYIGQSPYPWRSPGEQRVSFLVEPTHIFGMGR